MNIQSARMAASLSEGRNISDDQAEAVRQLNGLVADVFAIYIKTKSFHWHISGSHFRDYHLLLDQQASQIFAMTDVLAERVRKLGATTLRSIGHIQQLQHITDSDRIGGDPRMMLFELLQDNRRLIREMKEAHATCDEIGDVASASILENYIDEGEGRAWFLAETIGGVPAAL
jgi:starvation-inducible DNA-binding protein